jgi:hypothetical protein
MRAHTSESISLLRCALRSHANVLVLCAIEISRSSLLLFGTLSGCYQSSGLHYGTFVFVSRFPTSSCR